MTVLFNIFMRQTSTDDFWGLHKNMNCAFPLMCEILANTIFSQSTDSTFIPVLSLVKMKIVAIKGEKCWTSGLLLLLAFDLITRLLLNMIF